jgi:formylglycine-generating enzyme required for sulfatase activity
MKLQKSFLAAFALGAMAAGTAPAALVIPTVTVGDAGNTADSTGYGAVNYEYHIGKYEVTIAQYTAFLNAVAATDTYGLYNSNMGTDLNIAGISRSGSSGSYSYSVIGSGARPITYVSWFDAARFANWLANGQPTGAQGNTTTENGAYTLNGATSGLGFTKNANNPNTGGATTTWWIPSENEWYKAAYYDPGAGGPLDDYWLYPTRSDSAPGNTIGAGANQANYFTNVFSVTQSNSVSSSQNYLTDGGAFSGSGSYYGTFDQGGNVREWNDAVIGSSRGLRGGSWNFLGDFLPSAYRGSLWPSGGDYGIGFRVASVAESSAVPEPGQIAASGVLLVGGGLYWLVRRRKVTL